jgi:hypothetical protein
MLFTSSEAAWYFLLPLSPMKNHREPSPSGISFRAVKNVSLAIITPLRGVVSKNIIIDWRWILRDATRADLSAGGPVIFLARRR